MSARPGRRPIAYRDVAATLALATAAVEPATTVLGFTGESGPGGLTELAIGPGTRFDEAIGMLGERPAGPPDPELPFDWAIRQQREFDTFLVCTARRHPADPHRALAGYRQRTGLDSRLVMVGLGTRNARRPSRRTRAC